MAGLPPSRQILPQFRDHAAQAPSAAGGRLAQEMTETSPLGLRLTKECLAAAVDAGGLEQAIQIEDRNQTLCVRAGYIAEGARAFVEKRKPRFEKAD